MSLGIDRCAAAPPGRRCEWQEWQEVPDITDVRVRFCDTCRMREIRILPPEPPPRTIRRNDWWQWEDEARDVEDDLFGR